MKKVLSALLVMFSILSLSACTLSLLRSPTPAATPVPTIPSPTPIVLTPTAGLPTTTTPVELPSPTQGAEPTATLPAPLVPTPTSGGSTIPGSPSGPYAVILVDPADVLNIHSAAGAGYAVVGSFSASANNIMRTGPSTSVGDSTWVEVQKPGGGNGWVNAHYLAEFVPSAAFCSDGRVTTLIDKLDTAFSTNNGEQLSALVSPAHGMTVYLWRYGNSVIFDKTAARWVFDSTYVHHWGEAPGSGLPTDGAFHDVVLPKLQDVFNASYSLTCDSLGSAPQYGLSPWPETYANVNYYTVFKPGSPGVDLDWRYWLVGVEYIQGQPLVFALVHFQWEP
jgi:hypothetical protein